MPKSWLEAFRALGLTPGGVRSKLLWGFMLMSAVPLVMLILVASWFAFPVVREFYHLERWFPMIEQPTSSTWWLIGVIALTAVVAFLGSIYLTMKLIEPVIQISHEAKELAEGHLDHELPVNRDDELGELTTSLNRLTSRIRDNMTELKQFGERTKQINVEIHKRVVMLSSLFQVGELISGGTELDVVLDLVVEKLGLLEDGCFSFLCLQPVEDLPLTLRRARGLETSQLTGMIVGSSQTLIDAGHPVDEDMRKTWEEFGKPNLIIHPILLRNRRIGLLGLGNHLPAYQWSAEWVDMAGVFAKQTSIAIENDLLLRKTKTLSVRDELTGVYNEAYLRQRLSEEIKRAVMYQRPCALIMFVINELSDFRQRRGAPEAERVLKRVAHLIQESVTEIDRVSRFNGNELVVLLPERNKREALEIAEQIRHRIAFAFADAPTPQDRLSVTSGVAENPLDGVTEEELVEKAMMASHVDIVRVSH